MKSKTAEAALGAMARGSRHQGDICWPEILHVGEGLSRDQLRAYLVEAGLPASIAREGVSARRAFGLALSDASSHPEHKGFVIEREEKRGAVALVRQHYARGVRKHSLTWAKMELGPSGNIEVEFNQFLQGSGEGSHADRRYRDALRRADAKPDEHPSYVEAQAAAKTMASVLEERFIRHRDYVCHGEIGSMCVSAFLDWFGGTRLRQNGGVYYVPPSSSEDLRKFANVLSRVGKSHLPLLPIYDSAETTGTMGRQLHSELERQIAHVVSEASRLGSDKRKPRESSLQRRMDALNDIRRRSVTCGVLLDAYRGRLAEAIAKAEEHVTELLAPL